jgi:hypothetical protein
MEIRCIDSTFIASLTLGESYMTYYNLEEWENLDKDAIIEIIDDDGDVIRVNKCRFELVNCEPNHKMNKDVVNHPSHYNQGKFEVIDVIEDWNLGFNLGNCIKYIGRAGHKDDIIQDLKKAKWYLEREIKRLSHNENKVEPF